MGGPSTQTQNSITQQQQNTSALALQQEQQQYAQQQQLQAPAISYYQSLISGNPSTVMSASAPAISNITGGLNAAKEQIMNNTQPGAARDYALSQVPVQQATAVASTLNSTVNSAYDKLANLGAGIGAFSLQDLGASISAGSAASSSNQAAMQAQAQGKADTMGLLGSLVGAGAELGSAGITKSDRALKENITELGDALDLIGSIPVFRYNYRSDLFRERVGVMAQDVQQVLPDAVSREEHGYLAVDYFQIAALALAAVRELQQQVAILQAKVG